LLLRTALLPRAAALGYWKAWRSSVNLERDLDAESFISLPYIYRRISQWGLDDPLLEKLKGLYRRCWTANSILLNAAGKVLAVLEKEGVDFLLLGAAALAINQYRDSGSRPVPAVECLVRPEDVDRSIHLLVSAGWKSARIPLSRLNEAARRARSGWEFEDGEGHRLLLRWKLFTHRAFSASDEVWWRDSVGIRLGDSTFRTLDPMDLLLHVLCDRDMRDPAQRAFWIVDASVIMAESLEPDDWRKFDARARLMGLSYPAGRSLAAIEGIVPGSVSSTMIASLASRESAKLERDYFDAADHDGAPARALRQLWYLHRLLSRRADRSELFPALASFPAFLRAYTGKTLPDLVLALVRRLKSSIAGAPGK
jgi:hypothetical protein